MNKRESKRAEMFDLIELYHQGEETQFDFCERAGIKIHRFRYWLNRYKQNNHLASGFVRITAERAFLSDEIELRFPNGVRVGLGQAPSADLVAKLIRLW